MLFSIKSQNTFKQRHKIQGCWAKEFRVLCTQHEKITDEDIIVMFIKFYYLYHV